MKEIPTILQRILVKKRERVAAARNQTDIAALKKRALELKYTRNGIFEESLRRGENTNIIAELKRASPSKGAIRADVDIAKIVDAYESGGAAAISVLTEEDFFDGSVFDLNQVRLLTELPILRKDFIFDEFQILESRLIGADAVLLIAAMLDDTELGALQDLARSIGLDVMVEVHTDDEMKRAAAVGASVIGVNNRDLNTFEVSLETAKLLAAKRPEGALLVAESGISNRRDIDELRDFGFDGFLIGESLMRSEDPCGLLKEFTKEGV